MTPDDQARIAELEAALAHIERIAQRWARATPYDRRMALLAIRNRARRVNQPYAEETNE